MIKLDIEMPKSCSGCPFVQNGSENCYGEAECYCPLIGDNPTLYIKRFRIDYSFKYSDDKYTKTRHEDCPLIEVKEENIKND